MKRALLLTLVLVIVLVGGWIGYGVLQDRQLTTYQHIEDKLVVGQTTYRYDRVVTLSEVSIGDKIGKTDDGDYVFAVQGQSKQVVVEGSGAMSPIFLYQAI